jgi:parallel beta-helix repeat protein
MAKIGLLILTIVTFLYVELPCFATDYYVATTGTDGSICVSSPGMDNPCETIQYVINNRDLKGGDFIYIRAGTYDEHITIGPADSGSGGNYVTFKSYGNEDVTITYSGGDEVLLIQGTPAGGPAQYIKWDGRGGDSGYHLTFDALHSSWNVCQLEHASYIWMTGCKFTQAYNRNGLKLMSATAEKSGPGHDDGAKNCLIEYCKFYDNGDYGIKLTGYGTNNNTISHCDIYSNGLPPNGSDYYGFNFSGSGYEDNMPNGNIVEYCNIYSNYSYGMDVHENTNTIIRYNRFYSNGTGDPAGRGLSVGANVTNVQIYANEIYSNKYYGLELAGVSTANVYNNLIYNNGTGSGSTPDLKLQDTLNKIKVYNNTVYSDLSGYRIPVMQATGTNVEFKNNILVRNGSGQAIQFDTLPSVCNNNDFHRVGGTTPVYYSGAAYNITDLNNTAWAKGNIDEDPAWDANYRLTSSSRQGTGHVRDGGLDLSSILKTDRDGNLRPIGSGWDMGAYEYGNPVPAIAPPKNVRIIQ